jgi:GMP synthase-like glutamine amidotransferase
MTIRVLQHAANEGPGRIAEWAAERGHAVHVHHLYNGDPLPAVDFFDALVVMGGEMNIYQYRDYPWLKLERDCIVSALEHGRPIIGICLGAQLTADALGSRVYQNAEYELGWLPVSFTAEGREIFPDLPAEATVLHWHGDTFTLPPDATRLATSAGCPEQGFVIEKRCLGLQFHLEVDRTLAKQMVEGSNLANWPSGRHVRTPEEILREVDAHNETNRHFLYGLLDRFFQS